MPKMPKISNPFTKKSRSMMDTCHKRYPTLTEEECEDFVLDIANQGKLGGGKKRKSYRKKSKRKSKRKSYRKKSKRKSKKRSKRRR